VGVFWGCFNIDEILRPRPTQSVAGVLFSRISRALVTARARSVVVVVVVVEGVGAGSDNFEIVLCAQCGL
jgi:hypothetical protein